MSHCNMKAHNFGDCFSGEGPESQNTADRRIGYTRAFQLMDSTSPFSIGLKVPVGPFSTRYQASTSLQGQ